MLWWLQALAHTDGVDGPDLVEMRLQRLHDGVESERVGDHQQTVRTTCRFDNVNRLARRTGHGLFDQHGLTGCERRSTNALVQAWWGDDGDRVHLGITEQIYVFTVVLHIMFTGEGRAA